MVVERSTVIKRLARGLLAAGFCLLGGLGYAQAQAACTGATDPQPPNFGEVPPGPVTLSWKLPCKPVAVELRIDGTPVATLDRVSYTFIPRRGVTSWQVIAIDAAGNRADSRPARNGRAETRVQMPVDGGLL